MYQNLRQFLAYLRQEKLLAEIETEVDPYLELPEIHRRVIEAEGPALLFTKVKGSSFPVVTNMFGTRRRVDLAVGSRPERIVQQAVKAMPRLVPPHVKTLWQEREWLTALTKIGTRSLKKEQSPVLEVREQTVDLTKLPALTSWPEDGGPFITLPLVYTEHPTTGEHNLGMYRIHIKQAEQTGIHWQIHKGGGFHHYEAERLGQDLPVTLFLGGPPALILSAIAPLPEMLPELIFTSFLMGDKLLRVQIESYPHPLIAEAEFAFCGMVPAKVRRPEGPFGDHYGYYSLEHDFPIFNIHTVFRRRDAIYPATVVGKPRQEDYYIGEYLQALLAPLFPVVMPGVKSLWTYAETGFHALAAAEVRESYHREAVAHAWRILGEGQLTLTKFLLITDAPSDLSNFKRLLETILERFEPEADLIIIPETSMDTLDYTGRRLNHGSKGVMLGLGSPKKKLPYEYLGGRLPQIQEARPFCAGCLVLQAPSFSEQDCLAHDLLDLIQEESRKDWPLYILVDDLEHALDQTGFLWQVFTRFDPAHDIYIKTDVQHNRLVYHGPMIIDARMKPGYPKELVPDSNTIKLVDRRWNEYGLTI